MSLQINTNVAALNAQRNLAASRRTSTWRARRRGDACDNARTQLTRGTVVEHCADRGHLHERWRFPAPGLRRDACRAVRVLRRTVLRASRRARRRLPRGLLALFLPHALRRRAGPPPVGGRAAAAQQHLDVRGGRVPGAHGAPVPAVPPAVLRGTRARVRPRRSSAAPAAAHAAVDVRALHRPTADLELTRAPGRLSRERRSASAVIGRPSSVVASTVPRASMMLAPPRSVAMPPTSTARPASIARARASGSTAKSRSPAHHAISVAPRSTSP